MYVGAGSGFRVLYALSAADGGGGGDVGGHDWQFQKSEMAR